MFKSFMRKGYGSGLIAAVGVLVGSIISLICGAVVFMPAVDGRVVLLGWAFLISLSIMLVFGGVARLYKDGTEEAAMEAAKFECDLTQAGLR